MRLMTKTHGVMPTREEFEWLWATADANGELRDGVFHFGNDERVGTSYLTESKLWNELQAAYNEVYSQDYDWNNVDKAQLEQTDDWISCVLGCLGLEWV